MNAFCLTQNFDFLTAFLIASDAQASAGPSPTEAVARDWGYLFEVSIRDGSVHLTIGPVALIFGLLFFLIWCGWWSVRRGLNLGDYEVVSTTLKIGEIGEVEIAPNYETKQIAYKAWVDLSTRKIGLPFDPDHDVISEVYDSWYKAFDEIRDLAKSIPAYRTERSKDTRELVKLMIRVLNEGLRPHLTRWQAEFRRWYDLAKTKPANAERSPQAIQHDFEHYPELVADLQRIQSAMVEYCNFLLAIAEGSKRQ